ncbi:MAG: hypothetical protein D6732_18730 [Methanobacteriota archaeon]|nr:MAG: hypothetical protein D6732_18730 [Euryarchaeota archaeon]
MRTRFQRFCELVPVQFDVTQIFQFLETVWQVKQMFFSMGVIASPITGKSLSAIFQCSFHPNPMARG